MISFLGDCLALKFDTIRIRGYFCGRILKLKLRIKA